MSTQLPPITPEGLGGLLLWFAQAKSGKPDHTLLLRGLPHGRIKRARNTDDGKIAITIEDQRDGQERSERFLDPEGFFLLRVLLIPKAYIRVDRNDDPDWHYPTIYDDITLPRIMAGADRNQRAKRIRNHHDLTRSNLYIETAEPGLNVKSIHQGRGLALLRALEAFDKLKPDHWVRKALQPEDLEWIITEGIRLLDRLRLGEPARFSAE